LPNINVDDFYFFERNKDGRGLETIENLYSFLCNNPKYLKNRKV